jgi:hypothetical protein
MPLRRLLRRLQNTVHHSKETIRSEEQPRSATDRYGLTVVDTRLPSRAGILISGLLIFVSLSAFAAWGLIASAYVDDRYLPNYVAAGTRMALARYVNHGVLYPPLYDGSVYGGTRFMPLPILLHAAVARFTREYLLSWNLLNYFMLAAVLIVVFILLRRLRCPLPLSLILTACLLVTDPGFDASFLMLGDTLPTLFQLVAIATVAERAGGRRVVVGAALSALAFASKLSAAWGPISIILWLFAYSRRRLALFCGTYLAFVSGLMIAFHLASRGQIFTNVFGLSLAGVGGAGAAIDSPTRLLRILFLETPALWTLLPVAVLAAVAALGQRDVSIYEIAFLCQLPILLVVFTDIGVGNNQFFDLAVLSVLVIGRGAGNLSRAAIGAEASPARSRALRLIPGIVGLMLVWVTGTALVVLIPDVRTAFASITNRGAAANERPLEGWATPDMDILSEDPYIPVALDQTPIVLDPFMFPRVARRERGAVDNLVRRIEAQEFDLVVLMLPLEEDGWWANFHFGGNVIDAVRRAYVFSGRADGYYIYRPSEHRAGFPAVSRPSQSLSAR